MSKKSLSIQTKFTLTIIMVAVIPLIAIFVIFMPKIKDMLISNTIRNEQNATLSTQPDVSAIIDKIYHESNKLKGSEYYHTLFKVPLSDNPKYLALSVEAYQFEGLCASIENDTLINNIRVYINLPEENALFSASKSNTHIFPASKITGSYWKGIVNATKANDLFCPSFYLTNYELENFGDCSYVIPVHVYYENANHDAYVVLYYDSSVFSDIMNKSTVASGGVSYIINDRQAIIASTDSSLSSIYRVNYQEITNSLISSNNFSEKYIIGHSVYLGYYFIEGPDWYMVNVIPRDPLLKSGQKLVNQIFYICILIVMLGILISVFLAKSMTSRISSVISQMSLVKDGIPMPMDAPKQNDEIGELINTYNYMSEQIGDLMRREKESQEVLRTAEFNLLQAQINPHFLYNTMEMISWLAAAGENEKITDAVSKLSRFYRLTLSKKDSFVKIEDELEHVSLYMEIQNMRFGDAINFVVDVPDELMQSMIPKLSLQPLAENAILHGIMEKEKKKGTIVITGWSEGETAVLIVSDDGIGMDDEQISLILKGESKKTTTGTNVAVTNIQKRFELFFGEGYGLSYTSEPGKGTEATLKFPI